MLLMLPAVLSHSSLALLGAVYCVRPAAACLAYSFMSCIQSKCNNMFAS